MAENDFWQSMVNAAKSKTAEIFALVKNDIIELSSVVNAEVNYYSDVVKREANNLMGNFKGTLDLKKSQITLSGKKSLIRGLWSPDTIRDDVSPMIIMDSQAVPMTQVQYKHHLLVTDTKNFTKDFTNEEQSEMDAWYASADVNLHDVDYLGKQLTEVPALADMYRKLVPDDVTHSEFWKRYLFRRHLILDCCSEEVFDYDYVLKSEETPAENDTVLSEENEEPEKLKASATRSDEFITVEIETPYDPSFCREKPDDWDIEFEIECVKNIKDSSLSKIISAE